MTRGGLTGIEFAGKGVGFTPKGLIALLDQLPVALAVTRGHEHIYVYANSLYKSIHEPALGKLIGRSFASVFGDLLGDEYTKLRNRILSESVVQTIRDVHILHGKHDTYWDITLVPILNKRKKPDAVMSIAVEVTERVHARETAAQFTRQLQSRAKEISKERERLTVAVEATGIGIWEWDVEENRIFWSPRLKKIFGLGVDKEPTYDLWHSSLHPDDRDDVMAKVNALLEPQSNGELKVYHRIVLQDGEVKWIEANARMLYAKAKKGRKPVRLLGTVLDVTARRQAEEQLHEAVAMKDMLLRETHHRVKNSLQIVSAMLSLQERVASSAELKTGLSDAAMRIRTVAALHEQLNRAQSTTAVELSTYLASLCKDLESTVGGTKLVVEFSGEKLWIANERAISIALIVNELTTNALKYAYPDGAGIVRVRYSKIGGDRLQLTVEDDGVGLGDDFDTKQNESLGLMMAQTLARQLNGEIVNAKAERGTRFELTVNIRQD
ncbi:MAG TPA: histidine kinase dimerization/phosphoacceptor domain -containing protein [Aestuariivirgaceae bacterium]|nr:histidine kinase dimerization/phosphoacceptor domain -containing protein [Aestuariivirgaceae bacterium]